MPAHRRGPWSQAEDQYLMVLVQRQGASNWVRISQMIQSRSPKQCRERYHQNLKPNLNHSPITAEEGRQIEELVNTMGKRWAEIARRIPGRSDNAVKNWWNGGQNRRRRAGGRSRDGNSPEQVHQFPVQPQPYTRLDGYILPPPPMSGAPHDRSYPMESPNGYSQSHMYGQPKRPDSLDLRTGRYSPRHGYPTPLPSPSTYSMLGGETPSLISDSSLNISPSTPMGLRPLIGDRDERRNSQMAWIPANTTGFVGSDGHFDVITRPETKQAPPYLIGPPTFREPQWSPEHSGMLSQRPLPSYNSLQLHIPPAQRILASQTASPPGAAKVGISSILNQKDECPATRSSPTSVSPQTVSPQRSSKMDIGSLI